ncbi:SWI/SNF chromatin-remodeling complex subunit [Mortierella sp. AM989]|nr:SWI/SNF chromatin-remodeling complex subunit [Mortierella sp. AM989]
MSITSDATTTTAPALPNVGSSLLPQQNPTTSQIGPTPPITASQRLELEGYMRRDAIFVSAFEQQRQMQAALANGKQFEIRQTAQAGADIFGPGYHHACGNGSGITNNNGTPSTAFHIIYPAHRRRARKSKEFTFSKTMIEEQASKDDVLVPIRLEIDIDGLVLRDTFTWNLHESLISPEHFAEVLCEDLQFPVQQFAPQVARSIREQIQDYHLPALSVPETSSGEDVQVANEEAKSFQELRILIKIDITVANTSLVDQFEWDISCPNNDPEQFAEILASELGLGGEFRTAIAHSIREQVQTHTKCLNLIGYNYDGSSVHDEDLRSSFLPKISTILRDEEAVEQFTPILEKLTEPEIDKLERDRERDKRRKRRQTRGRRGVILPDREPSKTKRTLLHHGHTLESTDPILDPQLHDPTLISRLGPTTRRTAMTHDYSPVGSIVMSVPSLPAQGSLPHHRMTRKLRGSGSDLSVHHLGLPGVGAISASYSRDSLHGSRDKLTGGGREYHAHSPMRETTPVQSSKEVLGHYLPMEPRIPLQVGRSGYATTPESNGYFPPLSLGSVGKQLQISATNSADSSAQVNFTVVENLPKSLAQDQARLQKLYPSDHFEILVRSGVASGAVANMDEYRVRCLECPPGKLYNSGPDGTLQNFEVHLKSNRAHRGYVEQKKLISGNNSLFPTLSHSLQQQTHHHLLLPPLNVEQQAQLRSTHYQQIQRASGVGLGIEG